LVEQFFLHSRPFAERNPMLLHLGRELLQGDVSVSVVVHLFKEKVHLFFDYPRVDEL